LSAERLRFIIRESASRLDKGLLAVPQKFRDLFPPVRTQIQVVFDDGDAAKALTFQPYDTVVKVNRIFGLRPWFLKRGVREGDVISIALEDPARNLYRIALDRFVLERQEQTARQELQAAKTDSDAEKQLAKLSQLTRRRPREVARGELLRIAERSMPQPRPTVVPHAADRREVVPSAIRILLRELHDGKCQLCSFTFEKRNGEPYFEVHHLNPAVGHHPKNLLVVCPNCHAKLEHAAVCDLQWVGGWLMGLTITGKRVSIRQPLANESNWRTLVGLSILIAAAHIGRSWVRRGI
jgi:5-methylcytosine-specific restriction endonuclease McrA